MSGIDANLTAYGDPEFSSYLRRAFLASAGFDRVDLERPVVAIIDTSSDYTTCHRDMPALVEAVRRGVLQGGALPLRLPTLSLGEILISPTSMLYRNLLAMETEEALRAYPMDAAVLVGGCDKTVPAQLMAAASANVPSITVVTGPMRTGYWRGQRLGACTDCRAHWQEYRAGNLEADELAEVEQELCPTGGTCMVMGTASTMACLGEALGWMLPGGATAASGSGARMRHGVAAGRRAAQLATDPIRPRQLLSAAHFRNAVVTLAALGGSTNAVIHLLAIARRAGVPLELADFDAASRQVPLLVDCKPSGKAWLEDLDRAGGMPAVLRELAPRLDLEVLTVTGEPLASYLTAAGGRGADSADSADGADGSARVLGSLQAPIAPAGGLAVLTGSLAPDGAVIKAAAASPRLLQHRGPALVFESAEDLSQRIDDPQLTVDENSVLVLRNSGPAAAGMPETGSMPIPRKLAAAGVRDMVRISDARMSGTAGGTVVLHCSPEAARGGPLALVRDGDPITLDVAARRLELDVDERELNRRRRQLHHQARTAVPQPPARGWRWLHANHVLPAHLGADLDFMSADAAPPGAAGGHAGKPTRD